MVDYEYLGNLKNKNVVIFITAVCYIPFGMTLLQVNL